MDETVEKARKLSVSWPIDSTKTSSSKAYDRVAKGLYQEMMGIPGIPQGGRNRQALLDHLKVIICNLHAAGPRPARKCPGMRAPLPLVLFQRPDYTNFFQRYRSDTKTPPNNQEDGTMKAMHRLLWAVLFLSFVFPAHAKTTIYSEKNVDADKVDVGKIFKAIADDSGAMMKVSDIQKMITAAKKKKATGMDIEVFVDKGKLIMSVVSKAYKSQKVIVKDYEKRKAAQATVVNMQKGDKVIDDSSKTMAKAKGTKAKDADQVSGKDIKGDIIILAHGQPTVHQSGKVVAKKFAGKSPKDIVGYIVNDLKLSKSYANTVYLDGCYTAAGSIKGKSRKDLTKELNNFAQSVYQGLVKAGYKKLQVKGNLGPAITLDDGTELVLDAQTEKAFEKQRKDIEKRARKIDKACDKKLDEIDKKIAQLEKDEKNKKEVAKLIASYNKLVKTCDRQIDELEKEWNALKADEDSQWIENLVGTFGPEKL